jgi:hypothetical protein
MTRIYVANETTFERAFECFASTFKLFTVKFKLGARQRLMGNIDHLLHHIVACARALDRLVNHRVRDQMTSSQKQVLTLQLIDQ